MTFDEVFELGYLERVHGINGELLMVMDVDKPSDYSKLGSVFLEIKGKLIPFLVQKQKAFKATQVLLKFEDIDDEEGAADLVGATVHLPLKALPNLPDDKYYFHELVGMQVIPWTVNASEDMQSMLDFGVDGIITDYPDVLLELLKSR